MNIGELKAGETVGIRRWHLGGATLATVLKTHKNGVTVTSERGEERFSLRGELFGERDVRWSVRTRLVPLAEAEYCIATDALKRKCRAAWSNLATLVEKFRHCDNPVAESVRRRAMELAHDIVTEG